MSDQYPLNANPFRTWSRVLVPLCLAMLLPLTGIAAVPEGVHSDAEQLKVRRAIVVVTGDDIEDLQVLGGADGRFSSFGAFQFKLSRGYLGVGLLELTPELRRHFGVGDDLGVMISSVAEDSPAMEFGIKVGDIITAIDDKRIDTTSQVVRHIGVHGDGDSVTLKIWREGRLMKLPVTLTRVDRPQVDIARLAQRALQMVAGEAKKSASSATSPKVHRKAYKFSWNSDGAGPHQVIEILPENFKEAMQDLEERIGRPEFREQLLMMQEHRGDLNKRIAALEKSLQEMAEELHNLSSENP
ncbi:MAG: PDZ domain-containing protein [Thermoanaerobaculia bacterium]